MKFGTPLAAAALLALSACGGHGATSGKATADLSNPKLAALVNQAKGEPQLVFVHSFSGGQQLMNEFQRGFNARYGLNIRIVGRESSNLPGEMSKAVEEFRSGRPSSIDLIMGSENHMTGLLKVNGVQPLDWAWSTTIGHAVRSFAGGGIVPVFTRIPGITYNANKLKGADIPQTMEAVVATRHPLATTTYPSALTVYGQPEFWGEAKALAFAQKLSQTASGVINCGETGRILSGEFDLFAPDCGIEDVVEEQAKGATLGYVIPRDVPFFAYLYMGVPKNAQHKAAAQLFMDYLLTPEAQKALYKSEAVDLHRLPGSHTAEIMAAAEKNGTHFREVDLDYTQSHAASLGRLRGEIQQIIQHKQGG